MPAPFALKDCSLIAIATGRHAYSLRELSAHLREVETDCIYQHFWGGRMRPQFDEPEFQNDFSAWVRRNLNDEELSEQFGVLNPLAFDSLESLRVEMMDLIETRLARRDAMNWIQAEFPFSFVRAQIVVFDTGIRFTSVEQLAARIPDMTVGSIYYHFIEGLPRKPVGFDDFRAWISQWGQPYDSLVSAIQTIDPYFSSLAVLRMQLSRVFSQFFPRTGRS